jgi:LPPG:FO 2-phospho-L-lactate transferase|tara:strand:- start:1169 stop:2095 length:927 start_codon:yes stop_codon:yes gene_type:complete
VKEIVLTVLAGGTGSAKLVRGLARTMSEDITVIVNIGDNIKMHGLYICPDIDTILYTLSDQLNSYQGWGVKNDTYYFLDQISKYGEDDWFKLGDKDLALHIARTNLLRSGRTLSEATSIIADRMNIAQTVFPASDQHIETRIDTPQGEMHLQEFWVMLKGEPDVIGVKYNGPKNSKPAPNVINAILDAEKVIICPANPVTSIGPMTHIAGIKEALTSVRERVVAVSPIVGTYPVIGPAGRFLRSIGIETSSKGVADLYSGFVGEMIIDESDKMMMNNIEKLGVNVSITNIVMRNEADEQRLAQLVTGV